MVIQNDVDERSLPELHAIIDAIPDLLVRFDIEGRFTFISSSVVRATGIGLEAVLGQTPAELRICDDAEGDRALCASIARVLETGQPDRLEVNFVLPSGPARFEVRHLPELDEGRVVGVLGIARDLSAQRAAARQLYLLNYALDNVSDAIYLMKGDSPAFLYVNQAAPPRHQ